MPDINSINFGKVTISPNYTQSKETPVEHKDETVTSQQAKTNQVSADAVLDYLANSSIVAKANVKPSYMALVGKYNSPEAIARITAMMGDFEAGVIAGLAKFEEEMGAVPAYQNMSDAEKMALAAVLYANEVQE